MKRWFYVLAFWGATPWLQAQTAPGNTLRFTLDRAGAASVHYAVELNAATRQGTYSAASAPSAPSAPAQGEAAAGRPIQVSEEILKKLFAAAPIVRSDRCASHRKGIAQTGTKTLQLTQEGTTSTCTYNFSDEDRVNTATAAFEALAETMQFGDRLSAELRFDRLGLDAEMENLQSALTDGRALEIGNIGAVLVSVQNDERVMERVRRKAAHLLEGAGLPSAPPSPQAQGRSDLTTQDVESAR